MTTKMEMAFEKAELLAGKKNPPFSDSGFDGSNQNTSTQNDAVLRLTGNDWTLEFNDRFELLHLKDMKKILGFSRSWIYGKLNDNSKYYDPTFPKPIKINPDTGGKYGSVRWLRGSVIDWIKSKVEESPSI